MLMVNFGVIRFVMLILLFFDYKLSTDKSTDKFTETT